MNIYPSLEGGEGRGGIGEDAFYKVFAEIFGFNFKFVRFGFFF